MSILNELDSDIMAEDENEHQHKCQDKGWQGMAVIMTMGIKESWSTLLSILY